MSMTNKEVAAKQKELLFPCVTTYYEEPIAFERGQGARLWDVEGNEYLDFFGGILTVSLGHAEPRVTEAVVDQARKLVHTSALYPIPQQVAAETGVNHLRVELDAIPAPLVVAHRCERRVGAARQRPETGRHGFEPIAMAHPDRLLARRAGEQAVIVEHRNCRRAELALGRWSDTAAERVALKLHPIADAKDRNSHP